MGNISISSISSYLFKQKVGKPFRAIILLQQSPCVVQIYPLPAHTHKRRIIYLSKPLRVEWQINPIVFHLKAILNLWMLVSDYTYTYLTKQCHRGCPEGVGCLSIFDLIRISLLRYNIQQMGSNSNIFIHSFIKSSLHSSFKCCCIRNLR